MAISVDQMLAIIKGVPLHFRGDVRVESVSSYIFTDHINSVDKFIHNFQLVYRQVPFQT